MAGIQNKNQKNSLLLPVWGMAVFIILYVVAACLYPGGTFNNSSSVGYNWKENYWCELLSPRAKNGQINTARPVAIIALAILEISLVFFWIYIPLFFQKNKTLDFVMRFGGIGAMIVTPFMLIGAHDLVLSMAGLLGIVAFTATLINLKRHQHYKLVMLTLFCMLLCFTNNFIYHTGFFITSLPVIQKITFLAFLTWFMILSVASYKKVNRTKNSHSGGNSREMLESTKYKKGY